MTAAFLRAAAVLPLLLALPGRALADPQVLDIADLSIEELANIQVTSVSKKPEPLAGAANSIYVITADAIRRSGATSLPEVLRLAPNLQVAMVSNGAYAISARGLNGSNNSAPNKLQVLIDGRSVYSPLFSGVFWDAQDLILEDVERIEVISGPGGTLWGVNAVNGVINITTRHAADTAASLAVISAGRGVDAAFRQGGAGLGGHWRVYGKVLNQRATRTAHGAVNDERDQVQVGFRGDWRRGSHRVSLHANAYQGQAEQPEPGAVVTGAQLVLGPIDTSGVNLTGQWSYAMDNGGTFSVQGYLDRTDRTVPPTFGEQIDIADLQVQHTLAARGRHALVWGASHRHTWDDVRNSEFVSFLPARTTQQWTSLFIQDEVTISDSLRLTAGGRVERNEYTGTEVLPTLRLAYAPSPTQTLWASASRTFRAPSRLDADAFIPGVAPFLLRGGPRVRAERADVLELGYRAQPMPGLSYAVTAFFNDYDHLRTQEIDPGGTFVLFDSLMQGRARGLEMWGSYQASPAWRLTAGLMALHQDFQLKPGSNDLAGPGTAGKDPSHTAQLRSSYNIDDSRQLDLALRKVGALSNPDVPGYAVLDARFGWRVNKGAELSLIARNLGRRHGENGPLATRTEIAPSLGVKLVWER
ncbi:TonB-dependent receptor [Massilia sp. PAMC28688]|uniref:TonB-dependent receptor plug domain-containing protein n=1 Tax=Massilia sp. PAMC28688 TaxID=2861283 RepID=UPI001C6321FE|nr:TonB-dependent receptor [Massilia sp. PAMC28688]QYF95522.1 TonB-dependent receptor [Massilia sp. PAMC28688]